MLICFCWHGHRALGHTGPAAQENGGTGSYWHRGTWALRYYSKEAQGMGTEAHVHTGIRAYVLSGVRGEGHRGNGAERHMGIGVQGRGRKGTKGQEGFL